MARVGYINGVFRADRVGESLLFFHLLLPLPCMVVLCQFILLDVAVFSRLWRYSSPVVFLPAFLVIIPQTSLWMSLHLSQILHVRFFPEALPVPLLPPFDGFSQHLLVMILTFMYTVDLFPEFQVQMSNIYSISLPRCFTDTLNWKYPNPTESFLSSNWSSS